MKNIKILLFCQFFIFGFLSNCFSQKQVQFNVTDGDTYTSGRVSPWAKENNEIQVGETLLGEMYSWATVPKNLIEFEGDIEIAIMGILLQVYESTENIYVEMGVFSKSDLDVFNDTRETCLDFFSSVNSPTCEKIVTTSTIIATFVLTDEMKEEVSSILNNDEWVGFYFRRKYPDSGGRAKFKGYNYYNIIYNSYYTIAMEYGYSFRDELEFNDTRATAYNFGSFTYNSSTAIATNILCIENPEIRGYSDTDMFKFTYNNSEYLIDVTAKDYGPYILYFSISEGIVTIETKQSDYEIDTELELKDGSSLNVLATDDNGGWGDFSKITYDLNPTITSLSISGPTLVNENSSANYTCTAYYSDGSSQNVTNSATWSENSGYASISSGGVLTTSSVSSDQSCTITASYGGKSDTHNVTINNVAATLSSISISGSTTVNENSSANYTCTAYYSDGSSQNVTNSATWSENSGYASISSGGVLTTSSVSSDQLCTITVTYGGKSVTGTITIKNVAPTLSSISISGPTTVNENSSANYTCTANYSDGTSQNVTSFATWSENSGYATINSDGILTTSSVSSDQSCTISVTYGGKSVTGTITIKNVDGPTPIIEYYSHVIDDDNSTSSGDNDGLVEPGETIEMRVTLLNNGTGDAHNVSAILSTTDSDINIIDNYETYNTITAGGNTVCEADYDFSVLSSCPEKDVIFTLNITSDEGSWTDQFTVHIYVEQINPCDNIISISDCGSEYTKTYTGGGSGVWDTRFCGFDSPGEEQVYSFVAPTTGTYSIEVITANGYVDYGWKTSSCGETGWTCIYGNGINSTGTYGSMSWTAGTTYYILLDDGNSTPGTHQFYINCPQSTSPNIKYHSHKIDDDNYTSYGDNDWTVEPEEKIELSMTLRNTGNADANEIWATISTNDVDISITDSRIYISSIPAGSTIYSGVQDFDFIVSPNCPDKEVTFNLNITSNEGSWTDQFIVHIYLESSVSLPNLIPYKPLAWDYPIVPSLYTGTRTLSSLLINTPTYIDWANKNIGDVDISDIFYTAIYLDGNYITRSYGTSRPANTYGYISDYELQIENEGLHNLKIVTDYLNQIHESNEKDNEWSMDFYWGINVGIEEKTPIKGLNIYPNPTSNMLIIELNDNPSGQYRFELYNIYGKLLNAFEENVSSSRYSGEIDCSQYPTGTYLLKVNSKEGFSVKKFMVQH